MLCGPPVAFLVSLVAVFVDRLKGYAIAGLIISGLTCALLILPMLYMAFVRR